MLSVCSNVVQFKSIPYININVYVAVNTQNPLKQEFTSIN